MAHSTSSIRPAKKSLLRKIRWNTGFHGSIRCK
ncbi:Uncharacterised protein [Vibrio cholerae]|nr:Uncharacterised protein [Vibrio cholerae]